jgi:3-methyladenine DNA glycosylase AlkD
MNFSNDLETDLRQKAHRETAIPMENYMKNNFTFLGIKTEERRAIFKRNYEQHKAEIKSNFRAITWELFTKKEREFHQCAIDLICKESKKKYVLDDIQLIEKLLITNSWWDSVDTLAKYLLGNYLLQFPEKKLEVIESFSNSENMWLNRSAIIFQLDYKKETDFDLLKSICEQHKHSNEFFIQKAIGWALRDYSRFNPSGVTEYVNSTNLKPLSQREALRNIK